MYDQGIPVYHFPALPADCSCFEDIAALLRLDKSIRSDSITTWYKTHVRQLDSVNALTILNDLEHKAGATGNMTGVAIALFLKGQYFERK